MSKTCIRDIVTNIVRECNALDTDTISGVLESIVDSIFDCNSTVKAKVSGIYINVSVSWENKNGSYFELMSIKGENNHV